ncbi:MAG TPA: hypothetical protein VL284_15805 [Thermoanaerobaculia bacterium]|nr:hypothetical protein [Thermoanaerobaculia bacterium]
MKRRLLALFVFSLAALPLVAEQQVVLSPVYPIAKKYRSMEGPSAVQTVYLGDRTKPELVWLTAIRTEVVGADGKTPMPSELMCHMNVDIDPTRHKALFNLTRFPAQRLMTISQGMRVASGAFEARVPDGFAFPMASNEPLYVFTQVLNLNIEHPKNLKVRHRVTFEFVRDRDLKQRPVALFNLGISGMVQMAGNPLALTSMSSVAAGLPPASASSEGAAATHGASCLIGQRAPNAGGMSADYVDPNGRHFTGHWVVPPGKQVNASDVTWFMNLPYDIKLHYVAVHLHPFAQSLTLRDTTTGTDVFKATATNPKHRIGLEHVDDMVSLPGVELYKAHKYELVSVYDNPTKHNVDSMASMYFGAEDPEFVAPTPEQLAERGVTIVEGSALVLRTSVGDVGAMLLNTPTSLQVAKAIVTGAFRDAEAQVSDSGIAFVAKNVFPPTGEAEHDHAPGAISLCRGQGESSIVVETRKTQEFDGRCTVFAHVGPGSAVLRAIASAGSATLLRAEVLSGPDLNDLRLAPAKTIASK